MFVNVKSQRDLFFVLLSSLVICVKSNFHCKDGHGSNVEWFVLLKHPNSYEYSYLTPGNSWIHPTDADIRMNGPVPITLAQSYVAASLKSGSINVLYNNARPDGHVTDYSAHMKGVVTFNVTGVGFWLVHSVPKFPNSSQYIYPTSGHLYAQSFICVTSTFKELDNIGHQLYIAWPRIYESTYDLPYLRSTVYWKQIAANFPSMHECNRTTTIKSITGNTIHHVTKCKHFGKDLYEALVAPTLNTDLFVETWNHGNGAYVNSSCEDGRNVFNVVAFDIPPVGEKHKTDDDHSKWAISSNKSDNIHYVCVGDINRMTSQFKRGGGTLCINDQLAHQQMLLTVLALEPCNHKLPLQTNFTNDANVSTKSFLGNVSDLKYFVMYLSVIISVFIVIFVIAVIVYKVIKQISHDFTPLL